MYVAILGRQPRIGMAELERLYGPGNTGWFSEQSAFIKADHFSVDAVGGTQKAGRVILELPVSNWQQLSTKVIQMFLKEKFEGKVTLGISAYGFDISARDVQKLGLVLKQSLKKQGVNLRLVPNTDSSLTTATSHHNKLGLAPNKRELIIVRGKAGRIIVANSVGSQNITLFARRDQARPMRDAFVGMLPPKLALTMVNLAIGPINPTIEHCAILDPFCGTGVILQEALLRGCLVFGSDLNPTMVDYTLKNLAWLQDRFDAPGTVLTVEPGDATSHTWHAAHNVIDAVASEVYLGQPFSAPPSPPKLAQVVRNCDHIITAFLKNIGQQIPSGTQLCLAIPAWRDSHGKFTHLPLMQQLQALGYKRHSFQHIADTDLLYYRENQVVARELLVLTKA